MLMSMLITIVMMMCSLTLQDNVNDDHPDNNPIGDENSSTTTTTPPTATTATATATNGVQNKVPSSADDNRSTEEGRSSLDITNQEQQLICGICLDPLGRSANVGGEEETTATTTGGGQQNYNRKKFGLLTACDHIFCVNCLRTWRFEQKKKADAEQHSQSQLQHHHQQRPNDVFSSSMSQKVRACPECRQVSDFVVPSDRYVTGTEKQKAISEYQARLSCIQCKRFDGTLGSCPFGKDCFYAHYSTTTSTSSRNKGGDNNNNKVYDTKHLDKSKQELWQEKEEKRLLHQQQRRQQISQQLGHHHHHHHRGQQWSSSSRLMTRSDVLVERTRHHEDHHYHQQEHQPSTHRYDDLARLMVHNDEILDAIIESNDSQAFYQYLASIEMFQHDPHGNLVVGGGSSTININNEEVEDDVDGIEGTSERYNNNTTGGDVPIIVDPLVTLNPQYVYALFQESRFIDNNNDNSNNNNE